jgi:hypothetical protein
MSSANASPTSQAGSNANYSLANTPTPGSFSTGIQRQVAAPCLQFLLMEMVHGIESAMPKASLGDKEAVYYKLELLGYNVGQRLVEK